MTQHKIQYWVIPPKSDSEFVACMENVVFVMRSGRVLIED